MAFIYSAQLFAGHVPSGVTDLPPIGDGLVCVVRDVDVYWGGGLPPWAAFHLRGGPEQTFVYLGPDPNEQGAGGSMPEQLWSWRGRQVINPGEVLSIDVGNGPVDVTISGYLLTAP